MRNKKSILIVDDDIAHRTMLRILLDWQYEICEADDGSTAIEKIYRQNVDLVLMDVRMMNISGLEALEKIKAFNSAIPVIMMTAYASDDMTARVRHKGAFDCIGKPFDFDELRLIIAAAMDSAETRLRTAI